MNNFSVPVVCDCGFSTMDAKRAYEHAMNHEWENFRENICVGKQWDSCSPCLYYGGPSRSAGGYECRHPEHPWNKETENGLFLQ